MRTILFIILFSCFALITRGQAANQVFTNDTLTGADTGTFAGTKASALYQGVTGFAFTTDNDSAIFYLQGCWKTGAWYDIDTLNVIIDSQKNRILYQAPPLYKYYRLLGVTTSQDTCYATNIRHFLKY